MVLSTLVVDPSWFVGYRGGYLGFFRAMTRRAILHAMLDNPYLWAMLAVARVAIIEEFAKWFQAKLAGILAWARLGRRPMSP
jgi:hypothetical protein